jgi:hypothetical protein
LLLFLGSVGDISDESKSCKSWITSSNSVAAATSYKVHMSHHMQHWVLTCIILQSPLTADLLISVSVVIPQRISIYHFEVSFPARN